MTLLDLMDGGRPAPLTPPVERARSRGHRAAELAAARADRVLDDWTARAVAWTRLFAARQGARPWLAEDARRFAAAGGLPDPPDRRAWGQVVRVLRTAGEIRSVGTGAAKSSHGSPKVRWVKA
jgi:hypothetical protein